MSKRLLAVLVFAFAAAFANSANLQIRSEYVVKAAYIYNFAKFVEFPPNSVGARFVIGVIGTNPFEDELSAQFNGKQVGGHIVLVKRLDSLQAAKTCNIVYISSSEDQRVDDIVSILKGLPVLTIADSPGYVSRGVMINMSVENSRIRFDVNLSSSRNSHLAISSRLLSLAKEVTK